MDNLLKRDMPSYSHINPSKGKLIVSDLSPVVVMKKISLRVTDKLDLPELQDCDESQTSQECLETNNQRVGAQRQSVFTTHDENPFINSLTPEDLNNHIQKCMEMSSENKITLKNAFALQLIDCMKFLMQKKDFSTMACTLDAGTKIYSYRVDALHQQVLKLADEVIKNIKERQTNENGEGGEAEDKADAKVKRKANKRHIIAAAESLKRKPLGKDPMRRFIKVDGQAGALMLGARRDPKDLSMTIENSVPFWPNWERDKPLQTLGKVVLPQIKIIRGKSNETEHNFGPIKISEVQQNPKIDVLDKEVTDICGVENNSQGISDNSFPEDNNSISIDSLVKVDVVEVNNHKSNEQEVNVISTAMERMKKEAEVIGVNEPPSRLQAMKMLFADINDDYNYLNMKSVNYWAGPEFWKRSKNIDQKENVKKKLPAKKRYPKEIIYEFSGLEEKWSKIFKKKYSLRQKTISNWKKQKTTLPSDLKVHINTFINLYHISMRSSEINLENKPGSSVKRIDHNLSNFCSGPEEVEFMDTTSSSQDSLNDCFYNLAPENSASSEDNDQLNSCFYDAGLVPQLSSKEANSGNVIKIQINTSNSPVDDTFLVPAPKILSFQPIKYSARPILVDMQNLKEVINDIINQEIENDRASVLNQLHECSMETGDIIPKAKFSNIIKTLPRKLNSRCDEDVSPAMAFLALLTLANENNFQLENIDGMNDVVVKCEEKK